MKKCFNEKMREYMSARIKKAAKHIEIRYFHSTLYPLTHSLLKSFTH